LKPFDETGAFRPAGDHHDIRRLTIRGAGVTVFSSALGLVIQIVATVGLARLLTPQDFGLVALATTFSLLLMNVGLNGFTEAILQREEIDQYSVSNLFWINTGVGFLLAAVFAGMGSILAGFYHNQLLTPVTWGMSLTILFTSVSVQHLALLRRAMRFSAVAANDIVSRVVSLAVTFFLAWMGWGYWALVVGAVTQALSQSVGAWGICRWVPSLPRRADGTGAMLRFAIDVYARFSLNYISRNTDNLLVGWRFGTTSLGFYKKAYDLFALTAGQLSSPLTNVVVSALSRFDPRSSEFEQFLCRGISAMAFLGMGVAGVFTVLGPELIRVLLGPGWEESGRVFSFFAPGIGAMVVYYGHGWIHLSIGRADRWLRWGVVEVTVTCLLFLLGLPWGTVGIAAAWTLSFWILTIPAFRYAGRPVGLGVKPILAAVWRYLAASALAGCGCAEIKHILTSPVEGPGLVLRIVAVSVAFAVFYIAGLILFHRSPKPVYQMAALLREMISLRSLASAAPAVTPAFATIPAFAAAHEEAGPDGVSKPLVSILIPAYNSEKCIADTLRSALAQTWEPKEIIVVDDGSSDRTLAIAKQFESDKVRVVTQKNQGAATARNTAYGLSRGDYIQYLDADDLLAPDKIALQLEALRKYASNRVLLSSPFGFFKYRFYRAEFVPTALWHDLSPVEWLIRKLGQNVYMQTATWLISRELSEAAGPWNTGMLSDDDGEYFCRVLIASDGVRFVPNARVFYRAPWVGTLSYIGTSDKKLVALWESMQLHIGYLRSLEESERVRAACVKYVERGLIYFYPDRPDLVAEMQAVARDLGKEIAVPRLSWKYDWVRRCFGWPAAKRLQFQLPRLRWWVIALFDKILFTLGGSGGTAAKARVSYTPKPTVASTPLATRDHRDS
jgi:O-antigen/teichoic acid export membrane protein/glycosyltransferase involved in cell wall biosynthesis